MSWPAPSRGGFLRPGPALRRRDAELAGPIRPLAQIDGLQQASRILHLAAETTNDILRPAEPWFLLNSSQAIAPSLRDGLVGVKFVAEVSMRVVGRCRCGVAHTGSRGVRRCRGAKIVRNRLAGRPRRAHSLTRAGNESQRSRPESKPVRRRLLRPLPPSRPSSKCRKPPLRRSRPLLLPRSSLPRIPQRPPRLRRRLPPAQAARPAPPALRLGRPPFLSATIPTRSACRASSRSTPRAARLRHRAFQAI